jgi:hypothetical protein
LDKGQAFDKLRRGGGAEFAGPRPLSGRQDR